MDRFSFTPRYLTKNGRPWFPMMGEIHYSRVPEACWKETLNTMKSGGVRIASAYCIWMHHEQEEGKPDFSGNLNLRRFLETAKECGMEVLLRIGPWCHGEVRNGGFPDWLLRKNIPLRCNDPEYLAYVEKYYRLLAEQSKGLLLRDGGPVIGIQLENEYGHVGGRNAAEGEEHMKTLRRLAVRCGFDVPYYTATGWGGAVTGGALPVMGGYADAPWDSRLTVLPPSGNFVFTPERNDANIGSDHGFGWGITYDLGRFPFLTAELGGGLQVTHHRRPVASAADAAAMSVCKMGSGCSLLGYYMYAGGTNPDGKFYPLQESKATGYNNDLPVKSYDFNAPIRECGQTGETWRELRLIGLFLQDFGSGLAAMAPVFPGDSPRDPADFTHLRYSWRTDGKSGWLFVNNYVRCRHLAEHRGVRLPLPLNRDTLPRPDDFGTAPAGEHPSGSAAAGDVSDGPFFPSFNVRDGEFFFFPFNLEISKNCVLKSALATPLMRLNAGTGNSEAVVFYGDRDPQFVLEGDPGSVRLIHLTKKEALNAARVTLSGRQYLLLSEDEVTCQDGRIRLRGPKPWKSFLTWPELPSVPAGFVREPAEEGFTRYFSAVYRGKPDEAPDGSPNSLAEESAPEEPSFPAPIVREEARSADISRLAADSRRAGILPAGDHRPQPVCDLPEEFSRGGTVYSIDLPAAGELFRSGRSRGDAPACTDLYLCLRYRGDRMECWLGDRMISDGFFTGQEARISLRRALFDGSENWIGLYGGLCRASRGGRPRLTVKIYELRPEDRVYLECENPAKHSAVSEIDGCRLDPVYDVLF